MPRQSAKAKFQSRPPTFCGAAARTQKKKVIHSLCITCEKGRKIFVTIRKKQALSGSFPRCGRIFSPPTVDKTVSAVHNSVYCRSCCHHISWPLFFLPFYLKFIPFFAPLTQKSSPSRRRTAESFGADDGNRTHKFSLGS